MIWLLFGDLVAFWCLMSIGTHVYRNLSKPSDSRYSRQEPSQVFLCILISDINRFLTWA